MAKLKIADFKSQIRISEADFALLEAEGKVKLPREQRAAVENALKEYEFLRVLKEAGEGAALKKALLKLQAKTEQLIASIQAVRDEPGHIWEYLLAESDAKVSGLPSLLTKCKELNQRVARPGAKKDFILNSLLSRLADIFMQAHGRGTGISHADGRGGRFLNFAFAASKCLPRNFQPHSKAALGVRWDRARKVQREEKGQVHMWVGGPHPASAKPWFGKTKF